MPSSRLRDNVCMRTTLLGVLSGSLECDCEEADERAARTRGDSVPIEFVLHRAEALGVVCTAAAGEGLGPAVHSPPASLWARSSMRLR